MKTLTLPTIKIKIIASNLIISTATRQRDEAFKVKNYYLVDYYQDRIDLHIRKIKALEQLALKYN